MRIGVTGSRRWTDWAYIYRELAYRITLGQDTLAFGDCPTGADHITKTWASTFLPEQDWQEFKADWALYGNKAGPIRNQTMVNSQPRIDKFLAFPLGTKWSGTRDCMKRAKTARIHVINLGDK